LNESVATPINSRVVSLAPPSCVFIFLRNKSEYDGSAGLFTSQLITHLQNISPQLVATQEENGLLGLVVSLNVVGHDQWEFGNSVDDMTWNGNNN
jgi:hypothetical protein